MSYKPEAYRLPSGAGENLETIGWLMVVVSLAAGVYAASVYVRAHLWGLALVIAGSTFVTAGLCYAVVYVGRIARAIHAQQLQQDAAAAAAIPPSENP